MTSQPQGVKIAGISDEALLEKTGRTWGEWVATLDRAGCATKEHTAIARHVSEKHALSAWWSQMVAVGYEQARGVGEKHETNQGFSASINRTFDVPVELLFDAWLDDARRRRWYGADDFTITTATRPESLRISFSADDTRVSIYFYGKGATRSQVSVDQNRLATAEDVPRVKRHWAEALERLRLNLTV
jgi:hypothetical protein